MDYVTVTCVVDKGDKNPRKENMGVVPKVKKKAPPSAQRLREKGTPKPNAKRGARTKSLEVS